MICTNLHLSLVVQPFTYGIVAILSSLSHGTQSTVLLGEDDVVRAQQPGVDIACGSRNR